MSYETFNDFVFWGMTEGQARALAKQSGIQEWNSSPFEPLAVKLTNCDTARSIWEQAYAA